MFGSQSLLRQANFRHYSPLVKPECIYAAKKITTKELSEVENKETTFVKMILGPINLRLISEVYIDSGLYSTRDQTKNITLVI